MGIALYNQLAAPSPSPEPDPGWHGLGQGRAAAMLSAAAIVAGITPPAVNMISPAPALARGAEQTRVLSHDEMPRHPVFSHEAAASSSETMTIPAVTEAAGSWFGGLDEGEQIDAVLTGAATLLMTAGAGIAMKGYAGAEGSHGDKMYQAKLAFYDSVLSTPVTIAGVANVTNLVGALSGSVAGGDIAVLTEGAVVFAALLPVFRKMDWFEERVNAAVLQAIPDILVGTSAGLTAADQLLFEGKDFSPVLLSASILAAWAVKRFNKNGSESRQAGDDTFESRFGYEIPALTAVFGLLETSQCLIVKDELQIALLQGRITQDILPHKGENPDDEAYEGILDRAKGQVLARLKQEHAVREKERASRARKAGAKFEPQAFDPESGADINYLAQFEICRQALVRLASILKEDTKTVDTVYNRPDAVMHKGDHHRPHHAESEHLMGNRIVQ